MLKKRIKGFLFIGVLSCNLINGAILKIIDTQKASRTTIGAHYKNNWHTQNMGSTTTMINSGPYHITRVFWTSYYEASSKDPDHAFEPRMKIWEIRPNISWEKLDQTLTLFDNGAYKLNNGGIQQATFIADVQTGQGINFPQL